MMFQTKKWRKSKHTFQIRYISLKILLCLSDNVKKYGRGKESGDDNIIRRKCYSCLINKATDKQSDYVKQYLLLFHAYNAYKKAP